MRKKIVAANWKMNLSLDEGKILVENILNGLPLLNENRQVIIAPSFPYLTSVTSMLEEYEHIYTASQNVAAETSGAYTGEVAAFMLKSAGTHYAIIGHSERRQFFKEEDTTLAKKIDLSLANNLQIIFCCGEPLEIRDSNIQNDYVANQIAAAIFHLSEEQLKNVIIAYEPIWAIGTGRTASAAQAQEMHAHIRKTIAEKYGAAAAQATTLLYGGSCNDKNASELFACADVDGGLIGGASLKAETFLPIVNAMMEA